MVIAQIKEMIDEKLKAQAEKFLLECQNGFKVRSCIGPLFGMKLLGGGEFNLETHLAFLGYVKAFDSSKGQVL